MARRTTTYFSLALAVVLALQAQFCVLYRHKSAEPSRTYGTAYPTQLGAIAGVITLESFGAIGNGSTSATADQAAWNAAFAQLAASSVGTGPRKILLGANRTYLVGAASETLPAGCSIQGQGEESSILSMGGNNRPLIIVGGDQWAVRDLQIQGGGAATNPLQVGIQDGQFGVSASGFPNGIVDHVYFYNIPSGLQAAEFGGSHQGLQVSHCRSYLCGGFAAQSALSGTVTVTQNSPTVTFGTAQTTLVASDLLYFSAQAGAPYEIGSCSPSFASCTTVTLNGVYLGTTSSAGTATPWAANGTGAFAVLPLGEYGTFDDIHDDSSYVGLNIGAGNTVVANSEFTDSIVFGMWLRGDNQNVYTNDSHGNISNTTFNHATADAIRVDQILQGETFADDRINGAGVVDLVNSNGVDFEGGAYDLSAYVFNGSQGTVWNGIGSRIQAANAITNGNHSSTRWTPNNWVSGGEYGIGGGSIPEGVALPWLYNGTVPNYQSSGNFWPSADDGSGWDYPLQGNVTTRQANSTSVLLDSRGNVLPPLSSALGLPGVVAWYRADQNITLSGGNVTVWGDASGSGDSARNATDTTGHPPVFTVSNSAFAGKPTVHFTGLDTLNTGAWSVAPPTVGTIMLVASFGSGTSCAMDSSGGGEYGIIGEVGQLAVSMGSAVFFVQAPDLTHVTTPQVIIIDLNGAQVTAYVQQQWSLGTFPIIPSTSTGISLGNSPADTYADPLNGDAAEYVVSNVRWGANPAIRQQAFGYENAQYGLGAVPRKLVYVNATGASGYVPSPVVPAAGVEYIVDPTLGAVVFNPAGLLFGQTFEIKNQVGKPLSGTNTITINAMSGGQIEQITPANGTYGSSVVLNSSALNGAYLHFKSDGVNLELD